MQWLYEKTAAAGVSSMVSIFTLSHHQLNEAGKKQYLARWRSKILAAQAFALLSPTTKKAIEVHELQYEWFDEETGESVEDELTLQVVVPKK